MVNMSARTLALAFIVIILISYNQCEEIDEKIVGGTDAEISDVPYQIVLLYNGQFLCGGSIIGSKWIVTAAHCIYGFNKSLYSIRAGSTYNAKDGVVIKAQKVIPNPNYNPNNMANDIALVKLETPLQINNVTIKPVKLPAKVDAPLPKNGIISGWGRTQENASGGSPNLQKATVNVLPNKTCDKYVDVFQPTKMLCAGRITGGIDSCQGDSGGPLVSNDRLYGVVSFGVGCARANNPGVYTKVATYLPFIRTTIKNNP